MKKKLIPILLSVVFIISSFMTITAYAASPESQDGLGATLTLSKIAFAENENIDVSLTVTNNNAYAVKGIQTAITLPDGVTVKAGSLSQNAFSLAAGESRTSTPTIIKTANVPAANTNNDVDLNSHTTVPQTGDNSNLAVWLTIMLISGGTLAFFAIKNKKIKSTGVLSIFLCFAILGTIGLPTPANAASARKSFSVSEDITIEGEAVTISAEISYDSVELKQDTYSVTVDNGITQVGIATVKSGETVTINAAVSPKSGYHFTGWTVVSGGVTLADAKQAKTTFTMLKSDVVVKANYVSDTYTITATADSSGAVSPKGSITVNHGDSKKFDFTPNTGYLIKDVTVDGISVGAVTGYVFDNITADHTISVTFEIVQATTEEVTEMFRSYFYDESGNVKCNKLEDFTSAEWAVGSIDGVRPLEVFKDITGMDISVTESYNYKFVSSDGQSTISLTGRITPDDNAEYATMRVSIPACPEIQVIHFGGKQYFNGTNEEGVPVIFF